MSEIIERIKKPTPNFFKKLIKIGITLGAVGATIIGLPAALPIVIPAGIITAAGYMMAVGAVTASVSKLTVDDNKNNDENN